MIQRIDREKLGTMEVDQDLVVTGYTGEPGAALIAKAKREELRQWFSDQYIDTIEMPTGAERKPFLGDGKRTWRNRI